MAGVILRRLSKTYAGNIPAVREVTLEIADEEFVVLVGPSGCGKSTTLRLIAGLEEATGGEIQIGDRLVNNVPPKDRDIAMVFQNYALYPHMTVYKNMAFGLMLRKYPKREIEARVGDAAKILGLEDLLQRKPRALSGGQRQRVALGRAIVRQPAVFLFDEPLSNLDAKLRVQMRAELKKLHTRLRTTMIYVTHDQVEAMTMGDRIVVMLDGRIQQVATPTEIYNRPANRFVAGFIGSPPMNFVEGTIVAENGAMWFQDAGQVLRLRVDATHTPALSKHAGKAVTLGIRPETLNENIGQLARPGESITATVEVVEPMGAENYLYLRAGETPLIARVRPDALPPVGEPHVVDVAMANVHYFAGESGEAITT